MATLRHNLKKCSQIKPFFAARYISTTPIRNIDLLREWKPGPRPKTAEERISAAKKYGMPVEDYEPMAEDDSGRGASDYPNVSGSADWRDPYEDWDDPIKRTNYGETYPFNWEAYKIDMASNKASTDRFSVKFTTLYMFALFGIMLSGHMLLRNRGIWTHPMLAKQYPLNDLYLERGGDPSKAPTIKHYTFEPAE